MTKEEIFIEMDECLDCASISGFKEQVENLLKIHNDREVSFMIAEYLFNKYTAFRAGGLATYMEVAIKAKPIIAMVNHPENPLYRLAVIRGSQDLYDCYMEEAVEPFLANVNIDEHMDHYLELLNVAEDANEMIFNNYQSCIKGLHYNGAVPGDHSYLVNLNRDDYETMEDVVEQYNAMIGRREILRDLNTRIENLD